MKRRFLLTIGIIILMSTSPVSSAAIQGNSMDATEILQEEQVHYYQFDNDQIVIFYDAEGILTNFTGRSLYQSISMMTPNVVAYPISDIDDMARVLKNEPYFAAMYVFDSSYDGMKISRNNKLHSWSEVSSMLELAPQTEHIFAMGNTLQLLNNLASSMVGKVHGSAEEKVDAQHMYLYALWTLADLLEASSNARRNKLGNDIRMASLQYFSDNFNSLISSSVEPASPMGIEHPSTTQARVDAFYAEHPASVSRIPRDGLVTPEEFARDIDPVTGEVVSDGYIMDYFPKTDSMASDFILNALPIDSGQRGPIGGILDTLLEYLFDAIGGVIGLDTSTLNSIVDVLFSIPDIIGAIADPNASAIKGFIDKLKPMLPIPQDFYQYIDLLIDGLFVLRGSGDDIKNFISSAIEMIIPDIEVGGFNLGDMIGEIFTLVPDVINKIQGGGSAFDIILSVLNENLIANLTATFIGNGTIFGWDFGSSNVAGAVDKIVGVFKMLINTISTGNIKDLITEYGPDLLESLFPNILTDFGLDPKDLETVMYGVGMVMFAADMTEDNGLDSLQDLLAELLDNVVANPVLDDPNRPMTLHHISMDDLSTDAIDSAEKIIKAVGAAIESGSTDVTDLKNTVNTILTELGVDSKITKAVEDIAAIIVALSNPDFSIGGLSSMTTMVGNLLEGLGVSASSTVDSIKSILDGVTGVIALIKNPPNIQNVIGDVMSGGSMSQLITNLIKEIVNLVSPGTFTNPALSIDDISTDALSADGIINTASRAIEMLLSLIGNGISTAGNSIQKLMMTLLQGLSHVMSQFTSIDLSAYVEILKGLFGQFLGLTDKVPTASELLAIIRPLIPAGIATEVLDTILKVMMTLQDIFTNGFQAIFAKLTEYLLGLVAGLVETLMGELGSILGGNDWDLLDLDIPIGIGAFSLFTINIKISLAPHLEFNLEALANMIMDLVFKGVSVFKKGNGMDFGDILKTALSFFSISPVLKASFELKDFGSGSSGFLTFMLESMGVELEISGYGFFELLLFTFNNGGFNFDDFLKVIGWGFGFSITISRTFTILDFLTGGAGGGLNSIGKYIGLDAISIKIFFTLALDIVKRAATANAPETGSMTISIIIGFTVSLGIDIFIATLILTGTLQITLTLLQDLVSSTPLRVFISIELIITVTIGFLFWDWDFNFSWSPDGFEPPLGYELTSPTPEDAVKDGALGGDTDKDGLSDEYEKNTPGMNFEAEDTDGDTLSDKFETQTSHTDAAKKDTDGDGLDDNIELDINTNPLQPDSDFDGLNDYEESVIYGTNPLTQDTDFDGLTDYYEVNHAWNMTGITQSVFGVMIGGVAYDDRTDPLNPDTDADGLIDGEEGTRGIHYGPELYDYSKNDELADDLNTPDPEPMNYEPDGALVFNDGYTHPLDNDTDDDSYWQLYDGSKAPMSADRLFLFDMSDYREIMGHVVIYIDTDTGEPLPAEIVRTNPTNPDTDGDTGVSPEQRADPPFGFFLNSDGYELSRDPPTDPLDGDTDDDGLIDGLEGMLRPDSNHTWGLNPDTDGDGLGDMQEVLLGTDGRSVDTDRDGVSDGDEFFKYGTNPFLADTDSDGLLDGEELFLWHSSPFLRDTDNDGLLDYDEVWKYFSKPADEDSDNDFLTDYEEIMIYYTDPFDEDTDDDGLLDGEEILGFEIFVWNGTETGYISEWVKTDPNRWDTDNDSITALDQFGQMSQPMSDLQEFKLGLDPTRRDTDLDGIQDGWEIWIGRGLIPDFDPIMLDPRHPDSDGDGLADGAELQIVNQTMLLHPYIAFTVNMPFFSRPDMNDTDGDFLSDKFEIEVTFSRPDKVDTDNDTLSDYTEWLIYGTDLHLNDTDGDGLNDAEEIFGVNATSYSDQWPWLPVTNGTIFFLDPLESDSDGDLLPDGAEIKFYIKDPTDPDQDNNEILDGMEIDADNDGLYAGEEFYVYETAGSPDATREGGGGDQNPDSDNDGLFDGFEVYEVGSRPGDWDTDDDTYSDGLEYYCGTGILDNTTSEAEISACFNGLVRVAILSPASKTYKANGIPVIVYDSTGDMTDMTYRYREVNEFDNATWSGMDIMFPTIKNSDDKYWQGSYLALPLENNTYELEVTAWNFTVSATRTVKFSVEPFTGEVEVLSPIQDQLYEFNELQKPNLPINVQTNLNYTGVKFRIYFAENGTMLQDNTTLTYEGGLGTYYLAEFEFPDIKGITKYAIEIFATKAGGEEVQISVTFSIKTPTTAQTLAKVGVPLLGVGTITMIIRRRPSNPFKNPFKKST